MSGFEGLLTGRTLVGRYRIEEVIGRGGFAAVYRATDERLGRTVAVKVITAAARDAEDRAQLRSLFHREARAAAGIQHPNVVTIYDFGTDPELELDFLVMELLSGEDLARHLARSGPPPGPESLRILGEAAQGVAAGHRKGLIHRDVKPGNIFLAERERRDGSRVCVLDFGIVQVAAVGDETLTHLTRAGTALSPAYASPEQLRGDTHLAPTSDVFSLGVIGYELLAGERPFGPDRVYRAAVRPPPLRSRNPAVIPAVAEVIDRAMEPDPRERFPDAGEMAEQLAAAASVPAIPLPEQPEPAPVAPPPDEALPSRRVDAHAPTIRVQRSSPPAPPPPDPAEEAEELRESGARRRVAIAPAALLGLLALTLAVGGLWWAGARGEPEPAVAVQSQPDTQPPPVRRSDSPAVVVAPVDTPRAEPAETVAAPPPPKAPPPRQKEPAPILVGPREARTANREGERLFDQGRFADAVVRFRRAANAVPDNAHYRNNLGWGLFKIGEIRAARRELEATLRLDAGRDIAYANLGEVRLAQGDTAEAIRLYERFMQMSRDPVRLRVARDRLRQLRGSR